jgi:large subunit ribosomal protein L10
MPKTRVQKSTTLEELATEFKGAKSVAFANYQGLTVAQADDLRKKTREANVHYVVAKKTLFALAAKNAGFTIDAKKFPGMLGAAFATEDEMSSAKVLGDLSKTTPITLVGGIFEGAEISQEKIVALSKLPGKKELLGMLVGTMYAPVSAFVRALNAVREKREQETSVSAAPTPAAAATPTVEAVPAPVTEETSVTAEPSVSEAQIAPETAPVEAPAAEAAPTESVV